jgi:N-acetylmuramoyl-L-alanine amidase
MMRLLTFWFSLLMALTIMLGGQANAASSSIQLFLNGQPLVSEVEPRIVKGNTMVPIRVIAESLGSQVGWDGKLRKVTVAKDGITLQLFIDKTDVNVGSKTVQLEAAPMIVNGLTLLPLRFVSEQMGVKVTWDELTRSVFLFKGDKPAVASAQEKPADKPIDKPVDKPAAVVKPEEPVKAGDAGTQPVENKSPVTIRSISIEEGKLQILTRSGKVAPNVFTQEESNRLIIDLPNSVLDPSLKLGANGEGKLDSSSEGVSQIRYLLFSKEPSIVRIIVDLSKQVEFVLDDKAGPNEIAGRLTPVKNKLLVYLDAGHGGKDTGAISIAKRREKDYVLSQTLKVYELLKKEPKVEVRLTRSDDTFLELAERVALANEAKADLFVSIHANSAAKETVGGTETYYWTEQSLAFAQLMHKHVLEATGFPDRKVKQDKFYVIRNTEMPSVLLEIGFLSNKTEEAAMFDEQFQSELASSIAEAIKKQLKLK